MMQERKNENNPVKALKEARDTVTQKYGTGIGRSLQITSAAIAANIVVGFGKLLMGLLSLSFFTCMSAFYTFGVVIAKFCALSGILKTDDTKAQYRYYTFSGLILIAASILYIAYSVRLFFFPANPVYHPYVAITIATFTFAEIGLNLRGVIITRQNHAPLLHAIRMINLASSSICLVLTQTALLSFSSLEGEHSTVNGFMGVIMGSFATFIGISMVIRIRKIEQGKHYGPIFRKVKRLAGKGAGNMKLKPVRYEETASGDSILYVKCLGEPSTDAFAHLQQSTKTQLGVHLMNARGIAKNEETIRRKESDTDIGLG